MAFTKLFCQLTVLSLLFVPNVFAMPRRQDSRGLPPQTRDTGALVGNNDQVLTAGVGGPQLIQDTHHLEKLANFDRERIPERVVHAKGAGAHGVFVARRDFSKYTSATLFSKAGEEVETFCRFSTVIGGRGSSDAARDPRGFACAFYTREGNWHLVGNNLPVFFIRSSMKFPDLVHSLKPDPVRNVQDPNRFFDFFSLTPESTHMLTYLYSDLGIPKAYRTMDGNSVHAYKLVNAEGKFTYAKFNWKSNQGVSNLTVEEAAQVQSMDLDHLTKDLYDNIEEGNFPSWDLRVQLLDASRLDDFDFDPLDATKEWPEDLIPFEEEPLGTMTLNRNPNNFFGTVEQSAFQPGSFLRGIEPSEDQLLQGRLYSYFDTQLHRFSSPNFKFLPVNRPRSPVRNNYQDGLLNFNSSSRSVNYSPSRNDPAFAAVDGARFARTPISGTTIQASIEKTLNFAQAGDRYRRFTPEQRENLCKNFAGDLVQVTNPVVKNTICAHLYKADKEYGRAVAKRANCDPSEMRKIAKQLQE